MKVAITGSTGLIGSALAGALRGQGHTPVPVVRNTEPGPGQIAWSPSDGTIDAGGFEGLDAVVHLAGAGIGDKRWNDEYKRIILESRTEGTALLARTLTDLDDPPRVLVSASGMDYYGDTGDTVVTEESPAGEGFMAEVCIQWERAAQPAVDAGIRTCFLRTSIVQSTHGGALAKTLPLFKLGLGGRLGSGQQWWSWISIDDHVRAILHLLQVEVSGPVNMAAPNPVTNATWTKALGRELGRPSIVPVPKFGPRLVLGKEMADALLFTSHRLAPTVLDRSGFTFRHRTIEECLAAVVGDQELA